MKHLAALLAVACLTGCVTAPAQSGSGPHLAWARLGETVYVDGPKVTPVSVIADSRCPANVRCVWAGTVKITVKVQLGSGESTRELELGKPITVADGNLELVKVEPPRLTANTIGDGGYRFGLRFAGGL